MSLPTAKAKRNEAVAKWSVVLLIGKGTETVIPPKAGQIFVKNNINNISMQIRFFTIPITAVSDYNEEINVFLRSNKIIEIEKQLIQTTSGVYWCLFVSYVEHALAEKSGKEKIDYMKELPPEVFGRFSMLRKIRKEIANKENVSAFVIFTDAELAEMAKMSELSSEKIKTIKGIGKSKADKYGAQLIELYLQQLPTNETSGQLDSADSLF